MGCDVAKDDEEHKLAISIHAPVWGATVSSPVIDGEVCISIHAPVWVRRFVQTSVNKTAY